MKTPLTDEQLTNLDALMQEQIELHVRQIETLNALRRCYALAHLAKVHPDDLAEHVTYRWVPSGAPTGQADYLAPWRYRVLRLTVHGSDSLEARQAAAKLGVQDTWDIPQLLVPLNLWLDGDRAKWEKLPDESKQREHRRAR